MVVGFFQDNSPSSFLFSSLSSFDLSKTVERVIALGTALAERFYVVFVFSLCASKLQLLPNFSGELHEI